jgi:hypothetical protein
MSRQAVATSSFPANLEIPRSTQSFNHENFNKAMQTKFGCTLSYCSIQIGSSLNQLAHGCDMVADDDADSYSSESIRVQDIETYRERLIDFSFLKKLRMEDDEPFFPTRIYVRNDMRTIFGFYMKDVGTVKPMKRPTVLIGSPGVGKSVLFFLAALYRCSQKTNIDVVNTSIYYRWARSDRRVSVFIMFRDEDQEDGEHKVHVLFTRCLNENRMQDLAELTNFLETQLGIDREHYFTFVDGPNQSEIHKTLDGGYDHFCTSGGIRTFKSEEGGRARRWILSGWTKYESVQALLALYVRHHSPSAEGAVQTTEDTASVCPNDQDSKTADMMHMEGEVENQNSQPSAITANTNTQNVLKVETVITAEMSYEFKVVEEKANRAYWLCGGRIRELRRAYHDYEQIKVEILAPLRHLREEDILLAGCETDMAGGKNLDRLRTIFRDEKNGDDYIMYSFFVVESPFKLMYAANRVRVAQWAQAYILVKDGPEFIRGGFFEMAVHKWIETSGTDKTKSVEKSVPVGTVVDGVDTSTKETFETNESFYICSICKTKTIEAERENMTKKTSPIYSVCLSEGIKAEGVEMLSKSNVYWVPSKENFESIDSAVIIHKKLHVFQMTVKEQHGFNLTTLIEKFALPVWKNREEKFDSVFIHIVTPWDITFQCKAFTKDLADQFTLMKQEYERKQDKFFFDIELEPFFPKVDMTSVDTLGNSLKELLNTLSAGRKKAKEGENESVKKRKK